MKDQRGSALILVLILMSVLTILGLSLFSMTLSSQKQFKKTEEKNVATDLAEMGITHYDSIVFKELMKANNYSSDSNTIWTYLTNSTKLKTGIPTNLVEGNYSYEVVYKNILKISDTKWRLDFISSGKIAGNKSATINASIFIVKEGDDWVGNPLPEKSNFQYTERSFVELKGNNYDKNLIYPKKTSVYFENTVLANGNRDLIVDGNALFTDLNINGNVTITINGNVFFKNPIDLNGNSADFCIQGNAYLLENNRLKVYDLVENRNLPGCKKPGNHQWNSKNIDNPIKVTY